MNTREFWQDPHPPAASYSAYCVALMGLIPTSYYLELCFIFSSVLRAVGAEQKCAKIGM